MVQVGVRVGLLTAILSMVLALLTLVPLVGLALAFFFNGILWVIAGLLLARWRPPGTPAEHLVGVGLLVGLLNALAGGLMSVLLAPVGLFLLGGTYGAVRLLPPAFVALYQSMGLSPEAVFSPPGVFLGAGLLCGGQVLLAPLVVALSAAVADRFWGPEAWDLWEETPTMYMLDVER